MFKYIYKENAAFKDTSIFNIVQSHLQDILDKNTWLPNSSDMLSTQILVSQCHSLLKGTRAPWSNG